MSFTCPVCYFNKLQEPASDYNICVCCGTEFGNDDDEVSHDDLRNAWIAAGARWFFGVEPLSWNPWTQLSVYGVKLPYSVNIFFCGSPQKNSARDAGKDALLIEQLLGVAA